MLGSTTTTTAHRDLHIRSIKEHGRMNWQKTSGYNRRSKVEAAISRYKRVIGDALRSREDARPDDGGEVAFRLIGVAFYETDDGQIICHGQASVYVMLFDAVREKWPYAH